MLKSNKNVGDDDAVPAMSQFLRLTAPAKSEVTFPGKVKLIPMLNMPPDRKTLSYEKQLWAQQAGAS